MKVYGRTTVSEFLGDRVVFRNLEPVDERLPGFGCLSQLCQKQWRIESQLTVHDTDLLTPLEAGLSGRSGARVCAAVVGRRASDSGTT